MLYLLHPLFSRSMETNHPSDLTPEEGAPWERLCSECGVSPLSLSPKDIDFLMKLIHTSTYDEMMSLIITKRVHNRGRQPSSLQKILGCLVVFDVLVPGHPSCLDECFSSDEQLSTYCSERPLHEERVDAFYLKCVSLGIFSHSLSPSP